MRHVGSDATLERISKLEYLVRAMFCAPGRTRTYDRQIRRLLLYPLSYGGLRACRPVGRTAGLAHHCSAGTPHESVQGDHEDSPRRCCRIARLIMAVSS